MANPKAGVGSPWCWAIGGQPIAGRSSHEFGDYAFHRIQAEVVW